MPGTLTAFTHAWAARLHVPIAALQTSGTHLFFHDRAIIRQRRAYVYRTSVGTVILLPQRLEQQVPSTLLDGVSDGETVMARLNTLQPNLATFLWRDYIFYLPSTTRARLRRRKPLPQVRALTEKDAKKLDKLNAALSESEREEGKVGIDDLSPIGWFEGNQLLAVASFLQEDNGVLDVGVIVHPAARGQGLGKAVVAHVCTLAETKRPIQYSAGEANVGSLGIARAVGFELFLTEEGYEITYD